jgi:signal transduction histidine kinase
MTRIGAYVVVLASSSGVGLALAGGLRGAAAWTLFVFASIVGALALAAWIRATFTVDDGPRSEEGVEVAGSLPEAPPMHAPDDAAPRPQPDPDDVDYLMALRHEFRTPLNAVLGFADVLLSGIDGEVNDSQREDLEIIRASGIRLRILLDSALDLSQLVEGELRLDADRIDVRELVSRAATEAAQLWSHKRVARCSVPDEPCVAEADESRLRRSVLVLADFLASHDRNAEIALTLIPSHDHFAVELVADPSNALELDALPTIVEVLATEDATTIRRWPLAVTSEVIARHGGSLYHGNSPSRFRIRLPLGTMP